MLPLLFLIGPPSVIGGSFLMWYSGQQTVLRLQSRNTPTSSSIPPPPQQSAASYSAGIATLIGTYGLQSSILLHFFNRNQQHDASKHDGQTKQPYVPPKNMSEIYQRFGRPVVVRVGAGSVAFFCAGAIQTYVALHNKQE